MLEAAIILACAVAYRLRGSEFLSWLGTFAGRALWSAVAAVAFAASVPSLWLSSWWLLATAPFWFLGATFSRHGAIDLGRNEGKWWQDALSLLMIGGAIVLGGTIGVFLVGGRWWILLIAGLSMPLCYEAGWRILSTIRHLKQGPELGEAIYGAVIGAGIAAL